MSAYELNIDFLIHTPEEYTLRIRSGAVPHTTCLAYFDIKEFRNFFCVITSGKARVLQGASDNHIIESTGKADRGEHVIFKGVHRVLCGVGVKLALCAPNAAYRSHLG